MQSWCGADLKYNGFFMQVGPDARQPPLQLVHHQGGRRGAGGQVQPRYIDIPLLYRHCAQVRLHDVPGGAGLADQPRLDRARPLLQPPLHLQQADFHQGWGNNSASCIPLVFIYSLILSALPHCCVTSRPAHIPSVISTICPPPPRP